MIAAVVPNLDKKDTDRCTPSAGEKAAQLEGRCMDGGNHAALFWRYRCGFSKR